MPAQPAPDAMMRGAGRHVATLALLGLAFLAAGSGARGAEATSYPFEGTWVRAERACMPGEIRERTYTAKEVVSPRGRCAIRRIAGGSTVFELLEECRHNDRPMTVTETIRMTSPDAMALKRQVTRLKIPRQVRYARCTLAAQPPAPSRGVKPTLPAPDGKVH